MLLSTLSHGPSETRQRTPVSGLAGRLRVHPAASNSVGTFLPVFTILSP